MLLQKFLFVTSFCTLIYGYNHLYVAEVLHHYDNSCVKILDEYTIRARNSEDEKIRDEELKKYEKNSAQFDEIFDNVVYIFKSFEDQSCYKYKKYLYGELHDNPACAASNGNENSLKIQPWPVPALETHINLVQPLKITDNNFVHDIKLEE